MMKIIKEDHVIKPKVTLLFNFRFHYITSCHSQIFLSKKFNSHQLITALALNPSSNPCRALIWPLPFQSLIFSSFVRAWRCKLTHLGSCMTSKICKIGCNISQNHTSRHPFFLLFHHFFLFFSLCRTNQLLLVVSSSFRNDFVIIVCCDSSVHPPHSQSHIM